MSSCSLASTSSSSGSSLGAKSKPTLMNGLTTPIKNNTNTGAASMNAKMGNGGSSNTKSISFDETAERGDREGYDNDSKNKKWFFQNFKISFKNRREKLYRNHEMG